MLKSTAQSLKQHALERDALLERACNALHADSEVVAAWLFGSLGRGDADALSDIDLHIVLEAEGVPPETVRRHTTQFGDPLMILEALQNAPPQGIYHHLFYPASYGVLSLDAYWQPQKVACMPLGARLLFDKVGIAHSLEPQVFEYQPVPTRAPLEEANAALQMVWLMLFVTAKYAVRKPEERGIGLLQYSLNALDTLSEFLQTPALSPNPERASLWSVQERLAYLRFLAIELDRLAPLLREHGGEPPAPLADRAQTYLDLMSRAIEG